VVARQFHLFAPAPVGRPWWWPTGWASTPRPCSSASCAVFLDEAKEELAGMASSGMTGPDAIRRTTDARHSVSDLFPIHPFEDRCE